MARPDGTLFPLGARTHGNTLFLMHRNAEDLDADVVELPPDVQPLGGAPGWGPGRSGQPPVEPAWPWRWARDSVASGLKPWIENELLTVDGGPLFDELAWREAIALLHAGSLRRDPLSLDAVEQRLSTIPEGTFLSDVRRSWHLRAIRMKVRQLRERGESELPPPWPAPDLELPRGGWVGSWYSAERLLKRANAVYDGALQGYSAVAERWLPSVAPRLTTYATLPARLTGSLHFVQVAGDEEGRAALTWYFEPLVSGQSSIVELRLGDARRLTEEEMHARRQALIAARPHARRWLPFIEHNEVLDVFGATPATSLVFRWLKTELRRVKLLD
jgi:hypothetical protein